MSCITSILLLDLFFPFTGCPVQSEIGEIFPKTETIRSHNSRAGKPSNLSPVSREMISDSVVRNRCLFLAHPTYWNKCMTSKKRTVFLQKWILNPQNLPQNQKF